ncbi:hypothetical protein [Halorubrum miltondacostae]|uniref:hypothetical protein n=1 Tax=Halorubrum miltondacostae TaxID=3076378 RepID=UPI00352916A8
MVSGAFVGFIPALKREAFSSILRKYCLLLLSHVEINEADLREQAAKYGLEDEIDALLRYLETHGEVDDDRLPAWDEFQELAGEYEIE